MHFTEAAIAVAAFRVKVVVVLAQVAVNVVVPQPVLDVLSEVVCMVVAVNLGNTNTIVLPMAKGTFNANVNDIADGVDAKGFEMTRLLGDIGTTAVDVVIAVTAMLL